MTPTTIVPPRTFDVWPAQAPGETGSVEAERFEGDGSDSIIRITNVSHPTLTVYSPTPDKNNGATVVICPGGGYSILAWNLEGTEIAEWFNSIGITAIVLKYRVPVRTGDPRRGEPLQAPMQDAQRAVSLVRTNAAAWQIDPQRIGIMGFSAGGNLAAFTSTEHERRSYASIDEADKSSCRPDFAILIYPAWLADDDSRKLRPEINVTEKTPPMFFAHASNDGILPESSIEMYQALRRAGVTGELHVYATGGHGFGLRPRENEPISEWPRLCEAWLRNQGFLKS